LSGSIANAATASREQSISISPAVVEHGDPVGELVGLLQVLGGEEDRDAAGDEIADDRPHRVAAAGIQAGRRLVEEDQPRIADQGHGQVEPASHTA
jgi:hypothetical protein